MGILTPEEFFGGAGSRCAACALPTEIRTLLDGAIGKKVAGVPLGARRLIRWLDEVHPEHTITRSTLENHARDKHSANP